MITPIFKFDNYKKFLEMQVEKNRGTRGYLTSMARAAGCQLSVISHVLRQKIHLTPDQAYGLSEYWGLSELESDYFMALVHLARAASPKLERKLKADLEELRRRSMRVSERVGAKFSLAGGGEAIYYSSWHWMAIHIAASLSPPQTTASIAARLGLPAGLVQTSLDRLQALGLVTSDGPLWKIGKTDVHLPTQSPFTAVNHANWRVRALQGLHGASEAELHYTAVQSMTARNGKALKELALSFARDSRELARSGPEEDLFCITLDVFRP